MARFAANFRESFGILAPVDVVVAQFANLDEIVRLYGDLERAERVDEHTLRFLLQEQNHGVFTFQGRYECCYERDGDRSIVWASQGEGNIETRGRATVFDGEQPGSVRLDYEADMALEIDVNQLLAPVLDPVVRASISQQMRAYVKRMIDAIPKSA